MNELEKNKLKKRDLCKIVIIKITVLSHAHENFDLISTRSFISYVPDLRRGLGTEEGA